jgi:histidyl-tRNA synthetase
MVNAAESVETLLCRGMRDLMPDDMRRFRRIEQTFREACRLWGYDEIRTPTLEHLYLFTSYGTLSPQLLGRVYSFLDWDGWTGERVVLRPDATIPVARVYRERLIDTPAKLAYVTNIFRFTTGDEPREVWQCGAELIGDTWPHGDLELIALALHCVHALGVQSPTVRLSHTGIVRALFEQAGFAPEQQADLYDRLLDGDDGVVRDVEARLPDLGPGLRLLTSVVHGSAAYLANVRSALAGAAPAVVAPLGELELIARSVAALGADVEVNVTAVRNFEYYTGPVFHIVADGRTLAGGGRYDRLIDGADGLPRPACGFALYVDELMRLVSDVEEPARAELQVVPADESAECLSVALGVAQQLQACGIGACLVRGSRARWRLTVDGCGDRPRYALDGPGDHCESHSIEPVIAAILKSTPRG